MVSLYFVSLFLKENAKLVSHKSTVIMRATKRNQHGRYVQVLATSSGMRELYSANCISNPLIMVAAWYEERRPFSSSLARVTISSMRCWWRSSQGRMRSPGVRASRSSRSQQVAVQAVKGRFKGRLYVTARLYEG